MPETATADRDGTPAFPGPRHRAVLMNRRRDRWGLVATGGFPPTNSDKL